MTSMGDSVAIEALGLAATDEVGIGSDEVIVLILESIFERVFLVMQQSTYKYSLVEQSYFTPSKVKKIATDSSFLTWTTKRTRSKMDTTINTVTSSKMIPTSSVVTNPSASIAIETPMEAIVCLEQQISELNLLVTQY
ncbi:hypothetical protein KY290_036230 [Solanum tuberosum]|uniref:Polyprotein protein n=1 Tax=Solanum tuberosum TaxID=4113 RepID=A0ABQ7TVS8_SOLTU|nr:hypothetical protein KY290_036230 [Solanum tuberosum]